MKIKTLKIKKLIKVFAILMHTYKVQILGWGFGEVFAKLRGHHHLKLWGMGGNHCIYFKFLY
jgi:hypothetical protein